MKATSLWQPWASAVAIGAKKIETRGHRTHYRGPLAIHAAQRLNKNELIYTKSIWNWCGALRPLGVTMGGDKPLWELMPFGAVVATCILEDCRPTGSFTLDEIETPRRPPGETGHHYDWTERLMGNFDLGRFGWILRDVVPLRTPLPFKGKQGFFEVPDDLIKGAL